MGKASKVWAELNFSLEKMLELHIAAYQ